MLIVIRPSYGRKIGWRVSEILETNWDWCGLAFLALLSTELLWLLFYCVSMSDRKTLERKSKSYPAPSQQNVQNERKWTIFQKCLKRSGIAWNQLILILRMSLPIFGTPGRPERQLEDISKRAGERVRLWRQIGEMSDNERFFKSA